MGTDGVERALEPKEVVMDALPTGSFSESVFAIIIYRNIEKSAIINIFIAMLHNILQHSNC